MQTKKLVGNESFRELCRARELLGDLYHQPVSLRDAADEIQLSPWHFLREFRRAFGETPHEFLTRLRMEQAKQLLSTTSLSVTEICFEVGFTSLGSFSALFRRQVGISPATYRRQLRAIITVRGLREWTCIPFCFASAFGPGILPLLE